jgi:inorganic pyrophosphatase
MYRRDSVLLLPMIAGSVIRCRPVGMLKMKDEPVEDYKLLAVPIDKAFGGYSHIQDIAQARSHLATHVPDVGFFIAKIPSQAASRNSDSGIFSFFSL